MTTPTVTVTAVCGWCEVKEDHPIQIGDSTTLPSGWELRRETTVCETDGSGGYHRKRTLVLCTSCYEKASRTARRASKLSDAVRDKKHDEVWEYAANLVESLKEGNLVDCDPSQHPWPCTFCSEDAPHKIDEGYSGNPIVCTNCGFRTYKKTD